MGWGTPHEIKSNAYGRIIDKAIELQDKSTYGILTNPVMLGLLIAANIIEEEESNGV